MNLRNPYPDSRERLDEALATERAQAGTRALAAYFYQSPRVYEEELQRILLRSWIYAGHSSEIPEAGNYLTVEIGNDSIIVVRLEDGTLRALANTCRHRGARVCETGSGALSIFVCPYHAWTYNLDGSLRAARHMEAREDFQACDHALKALGICEYQGLIFINGNPDAADFGDALASIEVQLGAYELETAKVAHRQTYRIDANWKLCLENYLECYHCGPAHKAYARIHTLQDTFERVEERVSAMLARAPAVTGVPGIEKEVRRMYGAAAAFGGCVSHNRYGLYEGYLTGSEDGKALAPLMGKMRAYDGGAGDFQMGPVSFMLNYPDHCVLYRFLPRSLDTTDAEIVWFVRGDAQEGRDYDRDRLTWLWHHTTLEDKDIITRNRDGVHSHFYEPGPLQPEFEDLLGEFYRWYLKALS